MKLEVRLVNDALRMDLICEGAQESKEILELVEQLNGGPVDKESDSNRVFDRLLRIESIGFDDTSGVLNSIAFEEMPP